MDIGGPPLVLFVAAFIGSPLVGFLLGLFAARFDQRWRRLYVLTCGSVLAAYYLVLGGMMLTIFSMQRESILSVFFLLLLFLGPVLGGVLWIVSAVCAPPRRPPGESRYCAACGYDCTGVAGPGCPECGLGRSVLS